MNTQEAGEKLDALPKSDPLVSEISELFEGYRGAAEIIIGNSQNLLGAKRAGKTIFDDSDPFLDQAQRTGRCLRAVSVIPFDQLCDGIFGRKWCCFCWCWLARVYLNDSTQRARAAEAVNNANQQSILKLMKRIVGAG